MHDSGIVYHKTIKWKWTHHNKSKVKNLNQVQMAGKSMDSHQRTCADRMKPLTGWILVEVRIINTQGNMESFQLKHRRGWSDKDDRSQVDWWYTVLQHQKSWLRIMNCPQVVTHESSLNAVCWKKMWIFTDRASAAVISHCVRSACDTICVPICLTTFCARPRGCTVILIVTWMELSLVVKRSAGGGRAGDTGRCLSLGTGLV